MDPTIITTALATGATLALKDTASQVIKDAYLGLKKVLVDRFNVGSVTALEKDPTDSGFQKSLEKELTISSGLLKDPEVRELVKTLYTAIDENCSPEALKSIGVDVGTIKSNRNTIIRDVKGFDVGVQAKKIESGEDTILEGISGKPQA